MMRLDGQRFLLGAVALILLAGCAPSGYADSSFDALQTEVAHLAEIQAAQATELALQGAEATRLADFVTYLATVVPRTTPKSQVPTPTSTPWTAIEGSVLIEDGRCCAGGPAGQLLTLHAELHAYSRAGDVLEMRTRTGTAPAEIRDMANAPWIPYMTQLTFDVVPAINWTGAFLTVQFRDSQGNVSEIFWDDISVEGMPPSPTESP